MKMIRFVKDWLSVYVWCFGFHKHEYQLKEKYYMDTNEPMPYRYISVMVDGRQVHGGFADRIRGICTIYRWCKEKGIPFKINYTMPFRLEDYLEPNSEDWLPTTNLSYSRRNTKPICLMEWMLPHKYHERYLELAWNWSSGKSLHVYTNSHFRYSTFGEDFNALFKPVPRLQQQIDFHLSKIGGNYCAIVTRFQQLLGDFKEGNFEVLPIEEREKLIDKCVEKIKEVHKSGQRILCTSDSCAFLQEVSKLDFVYTMPGRVVHIDYTDSENYDTYMKSFLDFYMIANASKIILLRTGNMYRSGFPKTASMVYGRPFSLLEF